MSFLKPTVMLLLFSVTLKAFTQTSTPAIPSIHSQSITTITNTSLSLSSLAGKKIVFIIAPLSVRDTAKIRAIKEFQNKYDTSLQVVGIVTFEEGYKDSLKQAIINRYSNSHPIILTEAMYANETPIHTVGNLVKWLISKQLNMKFETIYAGKMQKFFINEIGELFQVASPSLTLNSFFIEFIVDKNL